MPAHVRCSASSERCRVLVTVQANLTSSPAANRNKERMMATAFPSMSACCVTPLPFNALGVSNNQPQNTKQATDDKARTTGNNLPVHLQNPEPGARQKNTNKRMHRVNKQPNIHSRKRQNMVPERVTARGRRAQQLMHSTIHRKMWLNSSLPFWGTDSLQPTPTESGMFYTTNSLTNPNDKHTKKISSNFRPKTTFYWYMFFFYCTCSTFEDVLAGSDPHLEKKSKQAQIPQPTPQTNHQCLARSMSPMASRTMPTVSATFTGLGPPTAL